MLLIQKSAVARTCKWLISVIVELPSMEKSSTQQNLFEFEKVKETIPVKYLVVIQDRVATRETCWQDNNWGRKSKKIREKVKRRVRE